MSKSENRKMLSTRISEELIDELTYYRKVNLTGELSQVDYITKAIEEKNERVKHLRDGGRYIKYHRIPIENRRADREKIEDGCDMLLEVAKKLFLSGEKFLSRQILEFIRFIEEDISISDLEIRKIADRSLEDINFETKNYYKYHSDESEDEI